VNACCVCPNVNRIFCWRIFVWLSRAASWLWRELMMQKEEVIVDERFGKEFVGKYVFGEISWARRSRIIQKHTHYHTLTGQIQSSDYVAIQAETVWASLREQPLTNPLSLEKLLSEGEDGVPAALGELFSQVVNRLCGVSVEDAKNS